MKRKLWKTILYIIITIVISIFLYFNIVDSIHENRYIKLATKAAEKFIVSKDFSLYHDLTEKSNVSTKEKVFLGFALFIATVFIIWLILKTSTNIKIGVNEPKSKDADIVFLKREYIGILVIGLLIFIYFLYNAIKRHDSIVTSLVCPINMLLILIITYRIEYKHIETYEEELGNFYIRIIFSGLFMLFLLIEFMFYKLIALTGLDIIKWCF